MTGNDVVAVVVVEAMRLEEPLLLLAFPPPYVRRGLVRSRAPAVPAPLPTAFSTASTKSASGPVESRFGFGRAAFALVAEGLLWVIFLRACSLAVRGRSSLWQRVVVHGAALELQMLWVVMPVTVVRLLRGLGKGSSIVQESGTIRMKGSKHQIRFRLKVYFFLYFFFPR